MITRLEYFEKYGTDGLALDIIPDARFQKYIRFRVYQNHLVDGKTPAEAIQATADECCCAPSRVYKAVAFFKKRIK